MITLWVISAIVIVLSILTKTVWVKRMKDRPGKIQNLVELAIESCNKLTASNLAEFSSSMAPYIFTLGVVLIPSGLVELLGIRAPGTDINFTIAMAALSFVIINVYSIRKWGFFGRIKWFGKPKAIVYPMKLLSHFATPISMACRMFGNLFSGLIIIELIYHAMGHFAIAIPGILSIFFNLFHVAMQAYVFMMLTLSFTNEGIE